MKRRMHAPRRRAFIAFALFFALVIAAGAAAKESDGTAAGRFGKDAYCASVAAGLGHELSGAEKAVANATWDYYNVKWKKDWTAERFAFAVDRGVKNCGSKAMIGSAKAGKKGKKGLDSLVEATEPHAEKVSDWIKRHTDTSAKERAEGGN